MMPHKLDKMARVTNPEPNPSDRKTRKHFVDKMQVGNIIAFTVDERMYAGKVIHIEPDKAIVRTKNGSVFFPKLHQIVWVRTGTRWPVGIYNALLLSKQGF